MKNIIKKIKKKEKLISNKNEGKEILKKEERMPKKSYKPGEKALRSGQYKVIESGGKQGPERTVVKEEPFPPTPRKRSKFTLVDPTKHKR